MDSARSIGPYQVFLNWDQNEYFNCRDGGFCMTLSYLFARMCVKEILEQNPVELVGVIFQNNFICNLDESSKNKIITTHTRYKSTFTGKKRSFKDEVDFINKEYNDKFNVIEIGKYNITDDNSYVDIVDCIKLNLRFSNVFILGIDAKEFGHSISLVKCKNYFCLFEPSLGLFKIDEARLTDFLKCYAKILDIKSISMAQLF